MCQYLKNIPINTVILIYGLRMCDVSFCPTVTEVKDDVNGYLVVLGGSDGLQVITADTDHLLRLLHEH